MECTAYFLPLKVVSSFKYLGMVLSESYNNCLAVICNLRIARQKWERLSWLLGREGSYERTSGMFYIAVVQSVLLYGLETWLVSLMIGKTMGGFQHQVIQRLMGRIP